MEGIRTVLGILSSLIFIAAFWPYIRSILVGQKKNGKIVKAQPTLSSWISWFALDATLASSMLAADTLNWQILAAFGISFFILILAIFKGKKGWSWIDTGILTGVTIGILLWQTLNDPSYGIICAGITMLLSMIPTVKSVWENPTRESKSAWIMMFISSLLILAATPAITLNHLVQPLGFTIGQVSVLITMTKREAINHLAMTASD